MPYSSNSDLPAGVRDKYSDKCQSVFRRVFNDNHSKGEERAFATAHAAAQRCMGEKAMTVPTTEFKIYSGALKAFESADGRKRLKTTASSTIKDLSGDRMTDKAIQKMAASAEGMTIFLNHSYDVPEDVFGTVKGVTVEERGEYRDLDFEIELAEGSDRAEKTYKYIQNGTKLGTSIGAVILDGYKGDDGYVFDDVALLEASIVGIPANPRSWVQYALKALRNEDAQPDAAKAKVWVDVAADGTVSTAVETDEPEKSKKKSVEPAQPAEDEASTDEPVEPSDTPAESVDADNQAEVTDGVDSPAQEAQKSVPETAEAKEPVAPTDGDLAEITGLNKDAAFDLTQFSSLLNLLKTTTGELVVAQKGLADEKAAHIATKAELKTAKGEMKAMKEIVERISKLPIGRRSGFSEGVDQFRARFGDLYDADFLKMLENNNG